MTTPADGETSKIKYTNSFKEGKHNFNVNSNNTFGINLATILNIYGVLPAIANKDTESNNSYNLFGNLSDVYNLTQGNAYEMTADNLTDMFAFYNDFESTLMTSNNVNSIISNNIKNRFPIIAKDSSGNYAIITSNSGSNFKYGSSFSSNDIVSVMDTYAYLLQIANAKQIVDNYNGTNKFYDKISFNTEGVQASDITVLGYAGTMISNNQISKSDGICTITGISTDDQILAGLKTTYDAQKLPNIYNSTKYYLIKQYTDEKVSNRWYYEYLFKATNLGIVNGDENSDFNAENSVTISEFLKMLIESADIPESELIAAVNSQFGNITSEIREHWARKYICYGLDKDLITIDNVSKNNNPDTYVLRCDTAYMINRLYLDDKNQDKIRIPSNLYKYSEDLSSDKNTLWKIGKAFKDQNQISYCKDEIRQLYLNGIMDGDTDGYVYWSKPVKRSEASKMIIKSRFSLDEGIRNINIVNEGVANYIDLTQKEIPLITQMYDKTGSGEFYFIAPKTGYYYISELKDCTVTVSDMYKREIQGLDAYVSATQPPNGARYNILKGEKAYIKVTATSSYSFKISIPGENELVFAPDRSGTFIYDNHPEYILQEDLADDRVGDGFGNSTLITANNISGEVDVDSSHLIRVGTLNPDEFNTLNVYSDDYKNTEKIHFDYRITNTDNKPISVYVENIGIQMAAAEGWARSNDITYKSSAGLQAWCDYTQKSLGNSSKFIGKIGKDGEKIYNDYIANNSTYWNKVNFTGKSLADAINNMGELINIPPGESRWILTDNYRPILPVYNDYGYSFGALAKFNIEGMAKLEVMAFYNQDAVASNPHSGYIFTSKSNRNYNNEPINYYYDEDGIEIGYYDVDGNIYEYASGIPSPSPARGELLEIGTKYKGAAKSLSRVETDLEWTINGDNQYYSPWLYNLSKPNGQKTEKIQSFNYVAQGKNDNELNVFSAPFWVTHINPTADQYNSLYGAYSDIMSFVYSDVNKTWHFGTNNYNAENNNLTVTSDMLEEKPYDLKAGSMGNFGVLEKYNIKVTNSTDSIKNVKYCIGTSSAFYVEYNINNTGIVNNIKCETEAGYTDNGQYYPNLYEIINFDVPAKSENKNGEAEIELSIIIPNVGRGGFYNVMYSN